MTAWFTTFGVAKPHAASRLLCLPSSGSGSTQFRPWLEHLPDIEMHVALLPGRERRLMDPPIDNLAELIDKLLPQVTRLIDRPYFLLGHSMGALIAFELTRALAARDLPMPRRLFVSGYRSPERPRRRPDLHQLPDDQFIDALRGYGGTPEAILAHRETMELLLPMIRADFKLHETHRFQPGAALSVPISALAGENDCIVPPDEMVDWKNHSARHFEMHRFPGGHFFIHDALERVVATLKRRVHDDLVESALAVG